MVTRCPECGAESLIWDYCRGTIVCPQCGLVVDIIYEENNITANNDAIDNRLNKHRTILEIQHMIHRTRILRNKEKEIRRIEKILNRIKNRKYLSIDEEALREYLQGRRPHVKLYVDKRKITINPEIERILKTIVHKDPLLSSRTERAKIAIAMIILHLIKKGTVSHKEIAKLTNTSVTHVKRLELLVQRRMHIISNYLNGETSKTPI